MSVLIQCEGGPGLRVPEDSSKHLCGLTISGTPRTPHCLAPSAFKENPRWVWGCGQLSGQKALLDGTWTSFLPWLFPKQERPLPGSLDRLLTRPLKTPLSPSCSPPCHPPSLLLTWIQLNCHLKIGLPIILCAGWSECHWESESLGTDCRTRLVQSGAKPSGDLTQTYASEKALVFSCHCLLSHYILSTTI